MRWRKLGRIFVPPGDAWWARGYATMPTVEVRGELLRIYFAALDDERRGRIGYVEVDARAPLRLRYTTPEPVFDLGRGGLFDDSGVNPSCIVRRGDERYLYYIGWQRCERVPYLLFAGLAAARADEPFTRVQETPVLDRTPAEPFLRSATSVLDEGGALRCWYVSGVGWTTFEGRPVPSYVVRTARSADGIAWTSRAAPCIGFANEDEFGFGRPWVVRDGSLYRMWYSIRSYGAPYRMGYAESPDGETWVRKDSEAGLSRSPEGWDSEMVCYPCVVDAEGARYMVYNGNRHGASGFGIALCEG